MKILRLVLCACLVLMFAHVALADGATDPKVKMGGTGSCQSFSQTSLTQTFTGVDVGCLVDFTNNITVNDESVTLFVQVVNIASPFTGALSCDATSEGSPFSVATVSSPTSCTFSAAIESEEQIAPGQTYSFTFLNDPSGAGFSGSTIDITLAQTVIATPEPASMMLLGVGLLGLLAKKKGLKIVRHPSI